MSAAAIELVEVTKHYGKVRAVENLSLAVPEGSLFGLIGPNGAGKTTTFSMMSGFLHPTSGEVRVRGVALSPGHPPVGRVLALPQDAMLPDSMRVYDCMVMLGRLGGLSKEDARTRSANALERVGLAGLASRKLVALSHGQRRRVGIAQTLIGDDEVVLLDEPTAGLDARSAAELRVLIRELKEHRTIVLSSHNLQEVEALCDRAAILDHGHLVASGTMDEIKSTSTLVTVTLAKPLETPDPVLIALKQLPGVRGANSSDDKTKIELELAESKEGEDEAVNAVLRVLIEKGASVRGVDRGKSLEQRFLEETGGENATRAT